MLAARLVRLIEGHADVLAHGLLHRLQNAPECRDLHKVPSTELKDRSYEIYRNLTEWLLTKKDSEVQHRYIALGARRAAQGVALSHLLWALMMTEEHLWEFLRKEGFADQPHELLGELELLYLVNRFFDRACYYAAVGYERAQKETAAADAAQRRVARPA